MISTFTSSSSRQSGAHSITSIIKLNAFTHTTSKTSEDGQIYLSIKSRYAKIGKVEPSLHVTMKVVKDLSNVATAMDGRNNNFIL